MNSNPNRGRAQAADAMRLAGPGSAAHIGLRVGLQVCRRAGLRAGLLVGLLAGLAAGLSACGPGVGGTGTGQSATELSLFGASTASVCNAPLAGSLSCGPDATLVDPHSGTKPVRYMDATVGTNTLVDFADNSVHLVATCQRLDFIGDWGITATQDQRYFGSVQMAGQPKRTPATLLVQPDAASAGGDLIAVLRDAQGKLLLGPLVLRRAPALLPVAPACAVAAN